MPKVKMDFSGYKDRVGQRVAPGRYKVIVEDTELAESSNKNQMINLWLRVSGGEFDGSILVDRLVLTEKSLFRVVGFMQALGMPTPKKKFEVDTDHFLNKALEVDVEDGEPYLGRVKSEVRGYFRLPGNKGTANGGSSERPVDLPQDLPGDAAVPAQTATVEQVPEDVDLENLDLG